MKESARDSGRKHAGPQRRCSRAAPSHILMLFCSLLQLRAQNAYAEGAANDSCNYQVPQACELVMRIFPFASYT